MPKPKSPLWGFVTRREVWEGQSQKARARCRACGVVFAHGRGGANRAILRAPLCHFNRFCVPQAMVGEKIRTDAHEVVAKMAGKRRRDAATAGGSATAATALVALP